MPATWSAFPITARCASATRLTEGEDLEFRRRAQFRAGNLAAGSAARRDEGKETQRGAAGIGRGRRRPGVPADRRLAGFGRRRRPAPARRAARQARRRIRARDRLERAGVSVRALDRGRATARCSISLQEATRRPSPRISTAISFSWRAPHSISSIPASITPGLPFPT